VVPSRVRSALDTLTEGVLLINGAGRIVFSNHAFAKYTHHDVRELTGKRVSKLGWQYPDDVLPRESVRKNDANDVRDKIALKCKDNRLRTFLVNSSRVEDDRLLAQGIDPTDQTSE